MSQSLLYFLSCKMWKTPNSAMSLFRRGSGRRVSALAAVRLFFNPLVTANHRFAMLLFFLSTYALSPGGQSFLAKHLIPFSQPSTAARWHSVQLCGLTTPQSWTLCQNWQTLSGCLSILIIQFSCTNLWVMRLINAVPSSIWTWSPNLDIKELKVNQTNKQANKRR